MKKILLIYSFIIFSKLFCVENQELKIHYFDICYHHLDTIQINENDTIEQVMSRINAHNKSKVISLIRGKQYTKERVILDLNETVKNCRLWNLNESQYFISVEFDCVNLEVYAMNGKGKRVPIFYRKSIAGLIDDIRSAFSIPFSKKIKLTFRGKEINDVEFIGEIEGIFADSRIHFIVED